MGFVAENGVCSLELMPYNQGDCGIRPTDQAKDDAAHYRVKYAKIDGSNPEEFRNAIASGHPVVISIPMTPEYRKTWRLGRDWVEDPDKTSNFWHAVCVIGYDDTREAYSPGAADDRYKGRLIVQNSWGHQGGFAEGGKRSGMFYISYQLLRENLIDEAYIIYDLVPEQVSIGKTPPAICSATQIAATGIASATPVEWSIEGSARITGGQKSHTVTIEPAGTTPGVATLIVTTTSGQKASRSLWVGAPVLDYTVEALDPKTPNVRHMRLNQDSLTQGLTEIQWQLTRRNPHVTLSDLGDRALITTSGADTKVSVHIKAKNGCGELSRDFDVNP